VAGVPEGVFRCDSSAAGRRTRQLFAKGMDSFRLIDSGSVAYLDLTGSGVETIGHVRENGRIVLMFCAFEGPPKIVRLHGRAEAVEPTHADFAKLRAMFPEFPGVRSVIRVALTRISDSCGYAVPFMQFVGERDTLVRSLGKKGEENLAQYRREKNHVTIDGLPGLQAD